MNRKAIWDSMLDADMNNRYWHSLGLRYYNYDKYTKIFLALMASSTVASWNFWGQISWLWKLLSGISALIAVAIPILDWPKLVQQIANVRQKWYQILTDYEILWLECNKQDCEQTYLESEYRKIKTKEVKVVDEESNLPVKSKLIKKCAVDVKISRGI